MDSVVVVIVVNYSKIVHRTTWCLMTSGDLLRSFRIFKAVIFQNLPIYSICCVY